MVICRRSCARIGPSRAMAPVLQTSHLLPILVPNRSTNQTSASSTPFIISTAIRLPNDAQKTHRINAQVGNNLHEICITCMCHDFQDNQKGLWDLRFTVCRYLEWSHTSQAAHVVAFSISAKMVPTVLRSAKFGVALLVEPKVATTKG